MNKVKNGFIALFAIICMMAAGVVVASPASATDAKVASVNAQVTQVSVNAEALSSANGKIELAWHMANGYNGKGKCVRVASAAKRGNATCFILPPGTRFVNSGVSREGRVVYYNDVTKAALAERTFYWDAKVHSWRKKNCGNLSKFGAPAPINASAVLLVRQFDGVTVKVTAVATAQGSASVVCAENGASSSASVTLFATGSASAFARINVRTYAQATAVATASLTESLKVQASASAVENAKATAVAQGIAQCSATGAGPVPPQPPQPPQPPVTPGKNGTTTPPVVPVAPGPNPPSGGGSYQCYSETTGLSVSPVGGLCPPGSFGA